MPPRRRTFYLADATLLSNPKIRGLARQEPDRWITVIGAFHILIGVATLNGSPRLTSQEIADTLGDGHDDLIGLLRGVGLMTSTGISRSTFEDWCPKPRPRYPSDEKPRPHSGGKGTDSGGVAADSGGIDTDSDGMPTSTTSSTSSAIAASSPSSRAEKDDDGLTTPRTKKERLDDLSVRFQAGEFDELEYKRRRDEVNAA
jgi:hypothetical protein